MNGCRGTDSNDRHNSNIVHTLYIRITCTITIHSSFPSQATCAGYSGHSYVVLGGRVSSRSLAPTLHVEGFRYHEILGPSTRYAIAFTLAFTHAQYPSWGLSCKYAWPVPYVGARGMPHLCSRQSTEPDSSFTRRVTHQRLDTMYSQTVFPGVQNSVVRLLYVENVALLVVSVYTES